MKKMSPYRQVLAVMVVSLVAIPLVPPTLAADPCEGAGDDPEETFLRVKGCLQDADLSDLPTPDEISTAAKDACGLILEVTDAFNDSYGAGLYAECVIGVFDHLDVLDRLGAHCAEILGNEGAESSHTFACVAALADHLDLHPQISALREACVIVADDPSKEGCQTKIWCCPSYSLDEYFDAICEDVRICLDELVTVDGWTDVIGPPCAGTMIETKEEVGAETGGGFLWVGFFFRWNTEARLIIDHKISWTAKCEAAGKATGTGGGGLLRSVSVEKPESGEQLWLCDYDGVIKMRCQGNITLESSSAAQGKYDPDTEQGTPPLSRAEFSFVPLKMVNEFYPTLRFVRTFDPAAADISGASVVLSVFYPKERDERASLDVPEIV